ncbi:thermonuclease family protein [Arthrobacter sp. ZGTC212]|uniref:thermonuclease family protein n=1 Tax=Arthrobacter sp. ZGTC212 TaxID=2058899 RepID=UPI000CE4D800|nr:thermonuclease family protein [Arthrobacter sp. ZGTC212]
MIGRTKVLAGAAAVLVAGTTIAVASTGNADEGTVIRVIDGDTLVVDFDDQELTVRLLNVDTPETKDPNKPVECLGPEATDFLTEALPQGSTVTLAFDVEREDRYGRTLAAVYDDEGLLINAEVARRGLGVPVTYEPNAKFRPPVDEAYQEAQEQQAGLFAEDVECTIPAMVAALEGTAAQAAEEGAGSTAASAAAAAAAVYALVKTVDEGFDAFESGAKAGKSIIWTALSSAQRTELQARVSAARSTVYERHGELTTLQSERQAAEDEVIRKAAEAKAEAERVAAQAEAERVAAAQAETDRIAAEAEASRAAAAQAEADRRAAAVPPAPTYDPPPVQTYNPPPAQSNNPPGYTGPRCYAPGGKSWRPC